MVAPTNNPVAKHARMFNKAHTMVDKKKRDKNGYNKHKNTLVRFWRN